MPSLRGRDPFIRFRAIARFDRVRSALRRRWENVDRETRGWLIVTAASVGRLAVGLIASIAIARALGPTDFGVYALLGVIATVAGVAADPGLTAAGVKRISASFATGSVEVPIRISSFVFLRVGFAFVLSVVVAIAVAIPAVGRLGLPTGFPGLVVLTMGGVVATALSGSLSSILQATLRFGRLSTVLMTNAVLTTLLALALARVGKLNLLSSIVVLGIGTSLASAWVGWRALSPDARFVKVPFAAARRELEALLRFGAWIWVADVVSIVAVQIDLPVVRQWVAPEALGTYALALSLASKADVVNHSLYTVLLPTASSLRGRGAVRRYLRRSFARSALVAAGLVALLPALGSVISILYGPAFASAADPLRALLGIAALDVFLTPVLLLAFHYDRPGIVAVADATKVVVFLGAAFAFVPGLGIGGAVIARLLGRVAGAAVALAGMRHASGFADLIAE